MIHIRQGTNTESLAFCDKLGYKPADDFRTLLCIDSNGLLAAVGYDNWTYNAVAMHIWVPVMLHKRFIREVFRYPFEMANLELAIGVTPGDNVKALQFNKRIGFTETYRIRDGWAKGIDMVIQELRREDCRWLAGAKHGRTTRSSGTNGRSSSRRISDESANVWRASPNKHDERTRRT